MESPQRPETRDGVPAANRGRRPNAQVVPDQVTRAADGSAEACAVRGCCWRGACPLHARDDYPVGHLAVLVAERPYGRRWAA